MQFESITDSIFEIKNFLSPEECAELISNSERLGFAEAGVSTSTGAQMMKGIRNNYRLEYGNPVLAEQLWQRARPWLPVELDGATAIGLYDLFRFYRYDVGERFNKHKDGSIRLNESVVSRWTFLLYLNDGFEGGETEFEGLTVVPQLGNALCFRHELRHKGCPVLQGRKYVLRTDVLYQE